MSEKKTISDLRDVLFDSLEAITRADKPMAVDRAKAVVEVAQTIINSAKVEVEFAKATGRAAGGGFIPIADQSGNSAGKDPDGNPLPPGITGVRRHRLVG